MSNADLERFPSKPYIKDGYPQNLTVLVNTSVKFECPQMIADLEPYLQWIKLANTSDFNENSTNNNDTVLQVLKREVNGEGW